MPNRQVVAFSKKFLWGASSSAHQVEGGQYNQWTVWELENAKSLAAQAPYQYDDLENWHDIKAQAERPANYVAGKATDHYNLFEQDIERVKKLNMNAFRFSIEWSRVQPQQDAWDTAAVAHYKEVLAACKKRDIEPIVTLFHFTLPVWFTQLGGFEKASNIRYFVDYAERILRELGPSVRYVITINEPEVYATESYYFGHWPPQQQSKTALIRVLNNLAKAHNRTADRIHTLGRKYRVSVAKNSSYIYPGDDSWLSVRAAALMQYYQDDYFLKKVIKRCDYIGVNFYFSRRVYGYRLHDENVRVSDMGWNMQPSYIGHAIERLYEKYHKPIFITENGLADADDANRVWWLTQTIIALQHAIASGIDVIGYLHWSLTDNFEWDKGFWPRFGLFAVNYKTMERTPRPSAVWLAKTLKKIRG